MTPSSFAGQARVMMQVIYNSDNYYVVEYSDQHAYELVDKRSERGMFFEGDGAARFMDFMRLRSAKTPPSSTSTIFSTASTCC